MSILTMVCFRSAGSTYCVPLEATRSVRTTDDLVALPDPAADVVGVLPGDPPLTVIAPLRSAAEEGGHILVMEAGDKSFGLLVDVVTGLERFEDAAVRPPPDGQDRTLVSGTLEVGGRLVMVADPSALAGRL
jgi:chemotaxis signal transduction protein